MKIIWLNPASVTLPYDYCSIAALSRHGYSIDYVGSETQYNSEFLSALYSICNNVTCFKVSATVAGRFSGLVGYIRALCYAGKHSRHDRVILFSFPLVSLLDLVFFAIYRRKIVYLIHNAKPHASKRFLFRDWLFSRYASDVWFASQYTANEANKGLLKRSSQTATILQHGCLPATPGASIRSYDCLSARLKKPIRVLGNIKPYKGVDQFIKLLEGNTLSHRVSIHGRWSNRLHDLKEEAIRSNIQVFDEFVDEHLFEELILDSSFIVLPYLSATQSGIFYNALFYGSVPLITDSGEMALLYRNYDLEALIFELDSIESFRACVNFVSENTNSVIFNLNALQKDSAFEKIKVKL